MTKALMVTDFLARRDEARRPAMNPAAVLWLDWPRDDVATVHAMVPRSKQRRDESPVTVLNKDWRR